MSIIIQAIPDCPKLYEDDSADGSEAVSRPETDLARRLRSAYEERFAFYERDLAGEPSQSFFPKVSVVFDDEKEEITFDFGLYESLLEIYIFEGWDGILRVEEALNKLLPQADEGRLPGGVSTKANYWLIVKGFFRFTRNLLALLIRETLIQIERKAAAVMARGLHDSDERLNNAYDNEFGFKQMKISRGGGGQISPPSETYYSCKNLELAHTLFIALSEAVQIRSDYDQSLRKIKNIQWKLDQTKKNREQGIWATPYTEGEEDLSAELHIAEQMKKLLDSMLKVIHGSSPFGLIVLNGLEVGFKEEKMVEKLGAALWELRDMLREIKEKGKVDEIAGDIDSRFGHVATLIPAVVAGERIALDTVQRWEPPKNGIENFVINTAIKQLADDPSWFPLVHEGIWHKLVESGVVAKDNFEYVVYAHYVSALIDPVEASEKFWTTFGQVAAALSLASLVLPPLRGVSVMADLVVMAHTIYSVIDNLTRPNQLMAEVLVHPEAFALEHLARIGELMQIRSEALGQITEQLALELALTIAGGRLAPVKKLMLTRGYYFDLETLLDDGSDE